jgi:protein-S-isoprenylcysteine O-methyltransferase Ste14
MKVLTVLYGVVVYAFFLGTFLYAIGFVGGFLVPTDVDVGRAAPLGEALLVDALLLGAFAVQHSGMARRAFKRWSSRFVPPALERSTFVLAASAVLALLLWQWRPVPEPVIWRIESPLGVALLRAVFFGGWAVLLVSTFLINHFELFGLRQVVARARDRELPPQRFVTPLFYRYVRHPIYLGFLIAFWATPVMTAGHLLFSVATSGYILLGIALEERDLVAQYGGRYRAYREHVGMLLPRWRRRTREQAAVGQR